MECLIKKKQNTIKMLNKEYLLLTGWVSSDKK